MQNDIVYLEQREQIQHLATLKSHHSENEGIVPSKHFSFEIYHTNENVLKIKCKRISELLQNECHVTMT